MGKYYNPRRERYLFDPENPDGFTISRSKIDLFLECPKCFYLDRRLGVARPPGYPFNLNSAVDELLKSEFDIHRAEKTAHPLMEQYGIDATPFQHEDIDKWRNWRAGLRVIHEQTGLEISGAIDDVWVNPDDELIVVDYKATSKDGEVGIDAEWQISYKRQMEVYQWILRRLGFDVSDTGYFVYANGIRDNEAFDGKLEFEVTLHEYEGDDGWVDATIRDIHATLLSDTVPDAGEECDYCAYRKAARDVQMEVRDKYNVSTNTLFD